MIIGIPPDRVAASVESAGSFVTFQSALSPISISKLHTTRDAILQLVAAASGSSSQLTAGANRARDTKYVSSLPKR